jgi:3-deoxy-D-manno-octulosonic-acid transferase
LYQYGDLAYIGGGFGVGIHNILEPAAFGLPVFLGPNYSKFKEAKDLVELNGAFEIRKPDDLVNKVDELLTDSNKLLQTSIICKNFVAKGCGATQIVMQQVNILLESRI